MREQIDFLIQPIHNNPVQFIIVMFFLILVFARLEYNSLNQKNFKDYKPLIISLGILGTFIGIFAGLWNFDTKNITASVPSFLDGLKLAFITSILGMGTAIILGVIENIKNKNPTDDSAVLNALLTELKISNRKQDGILNAINNLRETNSNQLKMLNEALRKTVDLFIHALRAELKVLNESFKKALDTLSKGATEEVIQALKAVISDFNKNLTEQFGENFKQLNESVKNMIEWQENYKTAIEKIEQTLNIAVDNIKETSDYTKQFKEHYEKISHISNDLRRILGLNENQIKNMETGLTSLKNIGDEVSLITISIKDFSKEIQKSLSEQSTGLNRLSGELNKQMESSLGNLNQALTSLTEKFRRDYDGYLENFQKVLKELNR